MKVKPKRQQRITREANGKLAPSAIVGRTEMLALNGPENDWGLPPVSIRSDLPWTSNLAAYPKLGEPGMSHRTLFVPLGLRDLPRMTVINCSLLYDHDGLLVGRLHHYPLGMFDPACGNRLEVGMDAGECSIVIRKSERYQGYGMELLAAADRQWSLDFWCQRYSAEGRAFVVKYLNQPAGGTNVGTLKLRAKVYGRLSS